MVKENEARLAVLILVVLAVFHFWYSTTLDLVSDEAYYWLWSKHLDASYFSKGPAVAWTIALGTWLGGDNVLGIRWLSVLLSAGTGWQLFLLGRRLGHAEAGLGAMIVAALIPLYAVGAVLMTIDPLSVFFWVWAANLFWAAIGTERLGYWIACGFAVGSGFLAKYVNALELLGFFVFLGVVPAYRKFLLSRQWIALLLMVLVCAGPVLWWNERHGWITTEHLKEGGNLDHGFHVHLDSLWNFFTTQALVIGPLLFMAILLAVGALLRKKGKSVAEIYLLCLFFPCFGFYTILSLNKVPNPNWTAPSYLAGALIAVTFWLPLLRRSGVARGFVGVTLVLTLVQTVLFHETFPLHLRPQKDPLMRVRGWQELGREVGKYGRQLLPDFLIANNYAVASSLAFYVPGHPTTYLPNTPEVQNQFSFWPSYQVKRGTTALFVSDREEGDVPESLRHEFSQAELVTEYWREYRGRRIELYRLWLLKN